jgi:hypothetical protein
VSTIEERFERRFTREELIERVAEGKQLYDDSHLLNATTAEQLVDELLRGMRDSANRSVETGQVMITRRATGALALWVEVGVLGEGLEAVEP